MINGVTALLTGQKDREKLDCILYNGISKYRRENVCSRTLSLSSQQQICPHSIPPPLFQAFLLHLFKYIKKKKILHSKVCTLVPGAIDWEPMSCFLFQVGSRGEKKKRNVWTQTPGGRRGQLLITVFFFHSVRAKSPLRMARSNN